MADIKVKIVPNPLYGTPGSLVKSPFRFQVVYNGTLNANDLQGIVEKSHPQMTEPLAGLTANELMTFAGRVITEDNQRFNFGSAFFAFEAAIEGSVPSPDAALGPDNTPYINVVNGQTLGAKMASITPTVIHDEDGDVMFRSVETVIGGVSFKNTINGGNSFTVIGKRQSYALSDEKAELVDPKSGETISAATFISADTLGQRADFRLAIPPEESGAYKLRLASHGKDTPDAGLKSRTIDIAYKAPENEITKIVAGPAGTPDDVIKSAYWIDLYGHGLEVAADGDVTADATYLGEPVHYTWKLAKVRTNTPEHLNLDYMGIDGTANFIADNNSEVTFTVNGVSHKAIFNPA